ncbi:MAG: nucleotidyltransferase [Phycisphaeraceae bacterium]|nr:nucleotidyltransferase [Phycisphaeraceae bacterium]
MSTVLTMNRPGSLNDNLDRIVRQIQLTDEQFDRATRIYDDLRRQLTTSNSPLAALSPRLFPQGSMLLRTTVKPFRKSGEAVEFDLDLMCVLNVNIDYKHADDLYANVRDWLRSQPEYADRIEIKDKCIRLNYSDELLHLDIIPAAPGPQTAWGESFLIANKRMFGQPIRTRDSYTQTDPLGFAAWFEMYCRTGTRTTAYEARSIVERQPVREPVHQKAPLRKIVQLIKHYRNLAFLDAQESPSSILITTLAAEAYNGETDLAQGLSRVLVRMHTRLKQAEESGLNVPNPTVAGEDLGQRLDEKCLRPFRDMIADMHDALGDASKAGDGTQARKAALDRLVGPSVATKALNSR